VSNFDASAGRGSAPLSGQMIAFLLLKKARRRKMRRRGARRNLLNETDETFRRSGNNRCRAV